VIVVNWNGARYLPACLDALAAQTYRDFTLWVVDNGSTDGSVALLEAAARGGGAGRPALRLLRNESNLGFAGGNNRALRAAIAEPGLRYCVLLNNDTVAEPGWLAALVAAAEGRPRVGSVASTMLFAARPDRVASAGITAHRDGLALDRGIGWSAATLPQTPQPVFGASAGAALYRRALLADIGLFDESFFSYLEDADLAWRARLRGWRAVWAPGARVLHEVSATGGQGSPFKSYHLARNRVWLIAKNLPGATLARCWPYILRYDLLALAFGAARGDAALIRGRAAALAGLGPALTRRRAIQAARAVPPAAVLGWLAPALGPLAALRARYDVDALLRPPPAP
jgi:GT2 family glycosyltransferase